MDRNVENQIDEVVEIAEYSIKKMSENLAFHKYSAVGRRRAFDALRAEGFTEDQALALTIVSVDRGNK